MKVILSGAHLLGVRFVAIEESDKAVALVRAKPFFPERSHNVRHGQHDQDLNQEKRDQSSLRFSL
jgi:hypothetical protein